MPIAAIQETSVVADRGTLFDPVETADIEGLFKRTHREKEEALMLAVLRDAIDCFQRYVIVEKEQEEKAFREAENWILEKNNDWLFSFNNICETLGFDSGYLRQGLLRWKEANGEALRKQFVENRKADVKHPSKTRGLNKRRWVRDSSLLRI